MVEEGGDEEEGTQGDDGPEDEAQAVVGKQVGGGRGAFLG